MVTVTEQPKSANVLVSTTVIDCEMKTYISGVRLSGLIASNCNTN